MKGIYRHILNKISFQGQIYWKPRVQGLKKIRGFFNSIEVSSSTEGQKLEDNKPFRFYYSAKQWDFFFLWSFFVGFSKTKLFQFNEIVSLKVQSDSLSPYFLP